MHGPAGGGCCERQDGRDWAWLDGVPALGSASCVREGTAMHGPAGGGCCDGQDARNWQWVLGSPALGLLPSGEALLCTDQAKDGTALSFCEGRRCHAWNSRQWTRRAPGWLRWIGSAVVRA